MKISFPSEEFPAFPRVAVEIPTDWAALQTTEAVLAAARTSSEGAFAANVVISIRRVAAPYETSDAAAALEVELAALPEADLAEPAEVLLGELKGYSRFVAFRHPDAGTIAQLHVIGCLAAGSAADVVHVVASIGGDRVDEDLLMVRDVVLSVSVAR